MSKNPEKSPSKFNLWSALLPVLTLVLGLLIGFWLYSHKSPKIAHIDSSKVFSAFALTKELQNKLKNTQQSRKSILDSMEVNLNGLVAELEKNPNNQRLRKSAEGFAYNYEKKKQEFGEDDNNQTQTYNEQIWAQLNQYIQDYADTKGYDYLLGANGTGAIMGASKSYDKTEEVIVYVNNKFKGGGN